jgi:hypothetical protein
VSVRDDSEGSNGKLRYTIEINTAPATASLEALAHEWARLINPTAATARRARERRDWWKVDSTKGTNT